MQSSREGIEVNLISAEDLILYKLRSGRLRDLADVEAIREARRSWVTVDKPPP